MKTSLRKLTAGAALIVIATSMTACSQASAEQNSAQAPNVQAVATQASASFAIEKMTCATCPISVKKAMKRVDGVKTVEVDFATKIATVVYDPAVTTPTEIAAASTNVGYPASETTS
ncbi:MAG: mercury transporter [Alphaproteobacteria bacterium]|nr:MAG: mercury transporter [Alphaproteobacteria bacterium]